MEISVRVLLKYFTCWLVTQMACVFTARAAGVVFSEIMYHPVDAVTGVLDGDAYEFIEIWNAGPTAVNLRNASFTKGITYTFASDIALAPGQYLVVVKDRAAFLSRYPAVGNLAPGAYSGSLANEGEKVTLKDALGNTLYSATYGTSGAWPAWAAGDGCSLVLIATDGDPDAATTWCASAAYNGTPGGPGGGGWTDVVINELLSHTDPPLEDAIEIHNLTSNALDLTGWYISDEAAVRKKFRLPATVLPARGFRVFYEYQFNTNALFDPSNVPFEFSSAEGDQAYLTAADAAGNLTRVVDIARFEPAENGVSFGRYPDGAGDWTTLRRLTFGTSVTAASPPSDLALFRTGMGGANSPPRVGPVAFGEIMYHPASDSAVDEYLELVNVTAGSVPLFDPAHPTNTWKLTTAVDFSFPPNVSIPAGGRLLVVGATNLPAFLAARGLSPATPIVGPWTGQLNNAGDSIRLYKPDPPDAVTGFVPYVLVERVDYGDSAPWPAAADGDGVSLERVVATNAGNSAANWFGGTIGGSPGVPPAGGFVNAVLTPAWPQPGQAVTVTAFVIAGTPPASVVCRTAADGVTNSYVMRDNGTGGDAAAADGVYAAVFTAPATGTWLYYALQGTCVGGASFAFPPAEVRATRAPAVTLSMGGATPRRTVSAGDGWETYEVFDSAGSSKTFTIQLEGAGDVLVDDVSVIDSNGVECVANGGFEGVLHGPWQLHGNHATSFIESPAEERGNRVLHVVCAGSATTWDVVSQSLRPLTVGAPATLRFRTRRVRTTAAAWLWTKIGTPPPDVAINEIMYHSAREDDLTGIDPHEYVELFNPGAVPVNLGGWYLDGAGFFLPAGTLVGAGQYVVCCASQQAVRAAYGITNTAGNWSATRARLKNGGESLQLYNPYWRAVDRVDYGEQEPWPVAADGYGPSLERLAATLMATSSVNWACSSGDTNWIQVAWTGRVGVAQTALSIFFTNAAARCWLDAVSVRRLSNGAELVTNGGFEQGTNGWVFKGNHAGSRVETGAGIGGGSALCIASTYSRWQTTVDGSLAIVMAYGDAASNAVATLPLATGATTDYVVSFRLRREGVGGCVRAVLGGFATNIVLDVRGTPGRLNTVAAARLPVGVTELWTDYAICPTGQANVVRARVSAHAAVAAATVGYRVVAMNTYQYTDRAYGSVALRDDGVAPDLAGGDGVFAATVPAQAANRVLVRYHVTVVSTNGTVLRRPRADDPSLDAGYWVESGLPQTNVPNWRLFVDGNPVDYPIAARACAVAPQGQVFLDAIVRHRGRPSISSLGRTGIALRVNRGNLLDTWFADGQGGINFRHRGNASSHTLYRRVVNEYVAYQLQRTLGLATPRYRHCCLWINGEPTVTLELEDPEAAFLEGNGIAASDYLTQVGYGGRQYIGGDTGLDNFWSVFTALRVATGPQKEAVVRTGLAAESVLPALSLLAVTANGDQHFDWNMFQHRSAADGRWRQYPWDVDMSFDINPGVGLSTTNLHPYYATPLHPGVYEVGTRDGFLLASCLFYPETGTDSLYTLPYRYRQQRGVWRLCHTLFTTNYLYPILDRLQADLLPVYQRVDPTQAKNLTNEVRNAKNFIPIRREFLLHGAWSDKRADIWNSVYAPTNVVITELMADPPVAGQEYVELYNAGGQTVDLGGWTLRVGSERHRLPLGTLLASNAYLVVADTAVGITNGYAELGNPATMVRRYRGTPLWDWPLPAWNTATEYATRLVEVPGLTLPSRGGPVELLDLAEHVVDSVPYTNAAPWPLASGVAIEVSDPRADNAVGTAWRACRIVGTPGMVNGATLDRDGDGLDDAWEQRIVNASAADALANVWDVRPGDDYDHDGVSNGDEFTGGTDPLAPDASLSRIRIRPVLPGVAVEFEARPFESPGDSVYGARVYALERAAGLLSAPAWTGVAGFTNLVAAGQTVAYTNAVGASRAYYRYDVRLRLRR